jgi:hypothetical protein
VIRFSTRLRGQRHCLLDHLGAHVPDPGPCMDQNGLGGGLHRNIVEAMAQSRRLPHGRGRSEAIQLGLDFPQLSNQVL